LRAPLGCRVLLDVDADNDCTGSSAPPRLSSVQFVGVNTRAEWCCEQSCTGPLCDLRRRSVSAAAPRLGVRGRGSLGGDVCGLASLGSTFADWPLWGPTTAVWRVATKPVANRCTWTPVYIFGENGLLAPVSLIGFKAKTEREMKRLRRAHPGLAVALMLRTCASAGLTTCWTCCSRRRTKVLSIRY
jgi:hypothetical protein